MIDGATMPTKVWALGGRLGYEDQGQTPNMHLSVFEYGDVLLVFETRGLVDKHENFPRKVLNEYYTTDGVIRGGKFYPTGSEKGEEVKGGTPDPITPGGPFQSFITSVRARDPKLCNAGPEHGHYSSALCHLGNIAYRVGSNVSLDTLSSRLDGRGAHMLGLMTHLLVILLLVFLVIRFGGEAVVIEAKAFAFFVQPGTRYSIMPSRPPSRPKPDSR